MTLILGVSMMILSAPVHGLTASEAAVAEAQEALEASYRLLDSTHYEDQVKASVHPMGLAVFDEFLDLRAQNDGITLADDLKQKLRRAFVEQLDLVVEEFTRDSKIEAGLLYAQYYTASELNRLAEIYRDPVMQKSLDVGPKLQIDLMTVGMQNMRKHQPGMEQRMKQVIDEYLSDILAEETS